MGEPNPIDAAFAGLCSLVRADQQREIAERLRKRSRAAYDAQNDEAGHALALAAQELEAELA